MEQERQENAVIIDVINWIKKHKEPFFTTVVIIAVIALIITFVCIRVKMVNIAASDKLNMAAQVIASGNLDQGMTLIDDIINTYGKTSSASRAVIIKAGNLIFQKKYDEAETVLKNYIENANPKTVRPIGYPLLISVYDNNNNPEQAISVVKEFLTKYPDNYLVPSVMENMARLYTLSGKDDEAKQTYQDIVDKFPETIYANRASEKLQ